MLYSAEGGGFFSSSASGYSKGLTLLLLGQKDDKPMRISPWNQYQLVDQEIDPDNQLASDKKKIGRGRSSLVCFGCSTAGLESSSPLKVGPTQHQEVLPEVSSLKEKVQTHSHNLVGEENRIIKVNLKSSLRKPNNNIPVTCGSNEEHEVSCEKYNDSGFQTPRRKVQWTDTYGGELVEIREFEPSDGGSDDEFDHGTEKACACIMMSFELLQHCSSHLLVDNCGNRKLHQIQLKNFASICTGIALTIKTAPLIG